MDYPGKNLRNVFHHLSSWRKMPHHQASTVVIEWSSCQPVDHQLGYRDEAGWLGRNLGSLEY